MFKEVTSLSRLVVHTIHWDWYSPVVIESLITSTSAAH